MVFSLFVSVPLIFPYTLGRLVITLGETLPKLYFYLEPDFNSEDIVYSYTLTHFLNNQIYEILNFIL